MGESIRFDRAVEYYDRTRALPAEMQTAMVEAASAELRGRGRVLEIGVGTGRIALPLHEAGVDVIGIDLSAPMLERLLDKAPGSIPVVHGDATRLPFRDRSFGAAYAVHVLHLIPDWKTAVDELVRVVEPGGTILVSQGWWGMFAYVDVIEAFAEGAGIELRHAGLNDEVELDAVLGQGRDLIRIEGSQTTTLRRMVDLLRDGFYSFTWGADEPARVRGAEAAAALAEERYGSLDEERAVPQEMRWRAYDVPD